MFQLKYLKNMSCTQRGIFIFRALGYFKLGVLLEGLRRLMPYKLALHVLVTFIEQIIPLYKHNTLFWIPLISGTKPATMKLTKSQRWSYLNTLTLHIYWVPHWPRVIWQMDSGVLFHTYVPLTNPLRHKKRMNIVVRFKFFALILI